LAAAVLNASFPQFDVMMDLRMAGATATAT
jgi:hypothetical protein